MAEVKNDGVKLNETEVKLVLKALESLKASLLRAKTKEADDEVMVGVYDRRIDQLYYLRMKITNGALF